jgi:FkbM family methyltransferase
MKRIIETLLRKAGWGLHRIDSSNRPTMIAGLNWLSDHNIHINTVLDVGASNGCWSRDCMRYFPDASYVLFEPQPVHSDALDSFTKSCKQTVIPVKKAVGGSVGETLFDAPSPFGGALAMQEDGSTIKVGLTTIDASISQLQLDGPYLLKLDTHGFEKSILDGASDTLEKAEILVIEAYNYKITDEALLFWELCAYLSEKGFRPIDLVDVMYRQHDNSLWQMDLFFIRSTWEGFNYITYK